MNLIFLNGPSSSGKTSLARELQDQLDSYYLYFGIDAFIEMMPTKSNCLDGTLDCDGFYWKDVELPNGETGKLVVSGEYGRKIEESFRIAIKALLESGNNLIVDNVVDGNREMLVWKKLLSDHKCCYVGVYCSLEKLIERETARGERVLGSAAEQYFRTHQGVEYDISVDTGEESIESCATQIISHITNTCRRTSTS